MNEKLVAKSSTMIRAATDDVWKALTDPAAIEQYMFGAKVDSEWHEVPHRDDRPRGHGS